MENKKVSESALNKLKYKSRYDNDDDIIFEHAIGSISLEFEDGYLALTHPKFIEVSSYSQKMSILNLFDEVNAEFKAVKFHFIKSYGFVSIEAFYGNEKDFEFVLSRSMKSMGNALTKFHEIAKKTLDLFDE